MAETKLNILICGLTSDSSLLFIPLYKYLKSLEHQVTFFIPEYSGAVCLIDKEIPFIRLKEIDNDYNLNLDEANILDICLEFDLKQNEFSSSLIRNIKKKIILNEGTRLLKACNNYFNKTRIDIIIVWGGIRYYSSIPANIAKSNVIPCIYVEKGLYPFTLQVDVQGVNGFGKLKTEFSDTKGFEEFDPIDFYQSLLKEKWYFTQPVTSISKKIKLKYFFKEFSFDELLLKIYHKYFETGLLSRFVYRDRWEITNPSSDSETIEETGYIFIPFQVSDDSQLLVQNNWIKDNVTLVESVIRSLNELGINRKIIIKEHPREFRKINYHEILKNYNIHFSKAGTIDLISGCSLVVTINSTVGFEALVFCKPVIITGSALYESIPFIHRVYSQSELTANLKKILLSDSQLDNVEVNKYVSTVYNKFVKCNYVSPSENGIINLWLKISALHLVSN